MGNDKPSNNPDKNTTAPGTRICVACQHYRIRPKYQLYSPASLQSPGVLKAKTEWEQQERQRAEQEAQRLAAGQPFDYEPHSYPWCANFTRLDLVKKANGNDADALATLMREGGAVMDPVSGKVTAIYVLCAQINPTGQCSSYEPRTSQPTTS